MPGTNVKAAKNGYYCIKKNYLNVLEIFIDMFNLIILKVTSLFVMTSLKIFTYH